MSLIAKLKPLGPLVVGLGGFLVLAGLGAWQVQRLAWKQGLIAEASARIAAEPVALPRELDPARDDYKPVIVQGRYIGAETINVLTSFKPHGPGYELVTPFETSDGRRILVNRGFAPHATREGGVAKMPDAPTLPQQVTGLLRWPDDTNAFTPEPNLEKREWYAQNVPSLAAATGAEPAMVVRQPDGSEGWPKARPPQVTLPNNHLQYAITWFSIALIWVVMSVIWMRRQRLARRGEPE